MLNSVVEYSGLVEIIESELEVFSEDFYPAGWEGDFEKALGGPIDVKSYRDLKRRICKSINSVFRSDPLYRDKYGFVFSKIRNAVAFNVGLQLGLEEEYLDDGEVVKGFIDQLEDGVSWTAADFRRYSDEADDLYRRCVGKSGFDQDVLELILGEDALILLANPFVRRAINLNETAVAYYLEEFLSGIDDGQSWAAKDLEGERENDEKRAQINVWKSKDGLSNGIQLVYWFRRVKGGLTEENILKVLKSRGAGLYETRPYEPKLEIVLKSKAIVKKYLLEFLGSLDDGVSWAQQDLEGSKEEVEGKKVRKGWVSADGKVRGINICFMISKYGGFNDEVLRDLLGDDSDILDRHPFVPLKELILSEETAPIYLEEFLTSRPVGPWSSVDMTGSTRRLGARPQWVSTDGKVKGGSLKAWISARSNGDHVAFMRSMSPGVSTLLDSRVHINRQVSPRRLRELHATVYLRIYLNRLEKGSSWSQTKLQQSNITPDLSGRQLLDELKQICPNDKGGVDWEYVCFKLLPINYLERNPFYYRGGRFYKTSEDATISSRTKDISEYNLGRGVEDAFSMDPEEALISAEEEGLKDAHLGMLKDAMDHLDSEQRALLDNYLSGEEIDLDQFDGIVELLRADILGCD